MRAEIIRKKMQKTVLKQGVQINVLLILDLDADKTGGVSPELVTVH